MHALALSMKDHMKLFATLSTSSLVEAGVEWWGSTEQRDSSGS